MNILPDYNSLKLLMKIEILQKYNFRMDDNL